MGCVQLKRLNHRYIFHYLIGIVPIHRRFNKRNTKAKKRINKRTASRNGAIEYILLLTSIFIYQTASIRRLVQSILFGNVLVPLPLALANYRVIVILPLPSMHE